ncbi:MAG TPA: hypothetical protein VGP46_00940, partial [Acidimicrobiales bacterium]|nr:hypothetical protein [Acidimicrobiales bacterium]
MSASKQFRLINYNLDGLYLADAVVVVLLATFGICLTNGVIHTGHPHGGLAASLGVLAMIVPVAWRRKAPLAAAIVVGVAGPLNGIVLGSMVRCGACLPAVFLIGYSIGAQRSRSRMAPALVFCAGNVVAQAFYDPQLGPIVTALMLPVLTGFFLLGLVARSRAMTAETLQIRSAQLRNQREATARLSAMADRSRIGAELDGLLRQRLGRIEEAAAAGSMALASAGPEAVASALSTIETEGRAVLRLMREIVGTLHDVSPNQPQPGLADLAALVESATTADARLTVDGGAYRLPAGVELSG